MFLYGYSVCSILEHIPLMLFRAGTVAPHRVHLRMNGCPVGGAMLLPWLQAWFVRRCTCFLPLPKVPTWMAPIGTWYRACRGNAPDIDEPTRVLMIREYEKGKSFIFFHYTMKLSAFLEPPLMVAGIAHHDVDKAREATATCLRSRANHVVLVTLQSEPILSGAKALIEERSC